MVVTDEIEAAGERAYVNGEPRLIPAHVWINDDGEGDPVLARAWYRGWDRANLSAGSRDRDGARDPRIGRTVHSRMCVDDEGKVECVCGLDDLAQAAAEESAARAEAEADRWA